MVSRIKKLKLDEDFTIFEYKVLIIIAMVVILVESICLIHSIKGYSNNYYCYIDRGHNLGISHYCRRNQCSSSNNMAIDTITYIKIK